MATPNKENRRFLREHAVRTALEEGWDRLANGDLLQAAGAGGFDLLLTTDTSMAYQQNLKSRKIAIVRFERKQVAIGAACYPQDRRRRQCVGTGQLHRSGRPAKVTRICAKPGTKIPERSPERTLCVRKVRTL